jgi:hypothetical protein
MPDLRYAIFSIQNTNLQFVERTLYFFQIFLRHFRVYHCGFDVVMAQKPLNITDVRSVFKKMRGISVPQTVDSDILVHLRVRKRIFKYLPNASNLVHFQGTFFHANSNSQSFVTLPARRRQCKQHGKAKPAKS